MTIRITYLTLLLPFLLLAGSCSSNAVKTTEPEIAVMDSVSNDLEKSTKELEEQAKKVEASLEKLEKES